MRTGMVSGTMYKVILEHQHTRESFVKVGWTSLPPQKRLKQFGPYKPISCQLAVYQDLYYAKLKEKLFHQAHTEFRYLPKNRFIGFTECYPLDIFPPDDEWILMGDNRLCYTRLLSEAIVIVE